MTSDFEQLEYVGHFTIELSDNCRVIVKRTGDAEEDAGRLHAVGATINILKQWAYPTDDRDPDALAKAMLETIIQPQRQAPAPQQRAAAPQQRAAVAGAGRPPQQRPRGRGAPTIPGVFCPCGGQVSFSKDEYQRRQAPETFDLVYCQNREQPGIQHVSYWRQCVDQNGELMEGRPLPESQLAKIRFTPDGYATPTQAMAAGDETRDIAYETDPDDLPF